MDFYNTTFYDKASLDYSERRYPKILKTYTQYLFSRRLKIIIDYIGEIINTRKNQNLRLLESGCADGIVIDSINRSYPKAFSDCIGTDISPSMIEVAKKRKTLAKVNYFIKNSEESGLFDVILAVGFISPSIFDDEFNYVKKHLKPDGIFICSLPSRYSLFSRIKLRDKEYAKDYWNYSRYEKYLKNKFIIEESRPYGLFIPKLWSFPIIARLIQPILEVVFSQFGFLFHEKLYLLKNKTQDII